MLSLEKRCFSSIPNNLKFVLFVLDYFVKTVYCSLDSCLLFSSDL